MDPENNTDYGLSDWELQERILFWVCAAGKNGRVAARSLGNFLRSIDTDILGPMAAIYRASLVEDIPQLMKYSGIGNYTSKSKTFLDLSYLILTEQLDLRTCTTEELEQIHGIGLKTSRCFILHSRPNAKYAGLDTHILKYLRSKGIENVPRSTPGKKEYLRLEKEFLKIAEEKNMNPADLDLKIWNRYSVKPRIG